MTIKSLDGLSVLVLEDEFFVALALESFLSNAGARVVETAKSLDEARAILKSKISAAILDVRLPDGTSFEFARELRDHGVAVTFYSGHTSTEHMREFPDAVFCPKPATPDQLIASVLEALKLTNQN